jgi:Fe2+ or Zn2+ uptake regulation protein
MAIPASEAQGRIRRFERLCQERGLPVTVQRRVVLEALLEAEDHPSADQVLVKVRQRVPGISQATVYRGLDLLVEMGLARKTCNPGRHCRYDANIHRHHHLVCDRCERMVDLEDPTLNDLPMPDRNLTGFHLVDYTIQFRGTCPDCLRAQHREGIE